MTDKTSVFDALSRAANYVPFAGPLKKKLKTVAGETVFQDRVHLDLRPFVPNSRGHRGVLAELGWHSAKDSFPLLNRILRRTRPQVFEEVSSVAYCEGHQQEAEKLASLFDHHGSDKSSLHSYHLVYARLLAEQPPSLRLLEIGMGTPNTALPSHMGAQGRPGASLRAFRDYLPQARIHGADVDRAILFSEERIETFFVDQTDPASFAELRAAAGTGGFDIIIDDGLHSPGANLAVILFALDCLAPRGVLVIEDIKEEALPVWYAARAMLDASHATTLVRDQAAYMLILRPRREGSGDSPG